MADIFDQILPETAAAPQSDVFDQIAPEQPQTSFLQDVGRGIARIPSDIIRGVPALVHGAGAAAETLIPALYNILQGRYGAAAAPLPELARGVGQAATFGGYQPSGEDTTAREAGRFMGGAGMFTGGAAALRAAGLARPLIAPLVAALMGGTGEKVGGGSFTEGATSGLGQAGLAEAIPALAGRTTRMLTGNAVEAARAQQALQGTEGNVARLGPGSAIETPLAQRVRAPQTTAEAFQFMEGLNPEALPSIEVPALSKAATNITKRFENTMSSLTPRGANVAEQISTATSPGEAGSISPMPGVPAFEQMTPQQQAVWAPVIADLSKATSGKLDLPTLQNVQQGIGLLTRNSDPRTAGFAKHLYRNLMDDVRAAAPTSPEAAQFYRATQVARQNFAAEDLADVITKNGTTLDDFGRLTVKPGAIMKKLQTDELLQDFPAAERKQVVDTLEQVFKAHRRAEQAPPPERGTAGIRHGMLGARGALAGVATAGVAEALGTGIPHYYAFALGNMAAAALPRAIFRAAMSATGRQLLTQLFPDGVRVAPPNPTAIAALQNFLQAQDAARGAQ